MNILITGANGFIGTELVQYFSQSEKYNIYGSVRRISSFLESDNVKYIEWDLRNQLNTDITLDVVIHTAARSPAADSSFRDYYIDNILGTYNLVDFIEKNSIKKVIYLGAVSSYGTVMDKLEETTPVCNPDDYGISKLIAEKMILELGGIILTLPGVVGTNCNPNWIITTAMKLCQNQDISFYNAEGYYNNILYVGDLCKFIEHIINNDVEKSQKYILGSLEKWIVKDVLSYLKKSLKSNSLLNICECPDKSSFYLMTEKAEKAGFLSIPMSDALDIVCNRVTRC